MALYCIFKVHTPQYKVTFPMCKSVEWPFTTAGWWLHSSVRVHIAFEVFPVVV